MFQAYANEEDEGERSNFIGVSFVTGKSSPNYLARLRCHGKQYHCGYFSNTLEAAQAINAKCVEFDIPLKNPAVGLPEKKPQVRFFSKTKKLKNLSYRRFRCKKKIIIYNRRTHALY